MVVFDSARLDLKWAEVERYFPDELVPWCSQRVPLERGEEVNNTVRAGDLLAGQPNRLVMGVNK